MKLTEIRQGEEITLEVIINGARYEFESDMVDAADGGGIYASPVRVQDKVLSFASDRIVVNLVLNRQNHPPVVWRRIRVETTVYKKNTLYRITSVTTGLEENRRSAFRLPIGLQGVAQIGANRKASDVMVQDISESGFSIVAKDDIENSDGLIVRLVFSDDGASMSLTGLVVRKVVYGEEKVLYGCKLNNKVAALSRYINERQRKQILKQKEVTLEQGKIVGYGDLRGKAQNAADDRKDNAIRGLSDGSAGRIKSDRYRNVNLNEGDRKNINYDRYKNLNLNG